MKRNYEMITVRKYLDELENVKYLSSSENEIENQVEKFLLNKKRYESNAKIVEAMLA